PFAFTGNRFEFRAAGSSSNCAAPMIAINAAMAHQLNQFKKDVDLLMDKGVGKDEAIFKVLKKMIKESKPICFEGDGYSDNWSKEAKKRGLTNIESVPEALLKYESESAKEVFVGEGVFNETELLSRVEVELEKFVKKIQIESRVLGDLTINHIVPIAVTYQNRLLENLIGLKQIFDKEEYEELSFARKQLVKEISKYVSEIKLQVKEMTNQRKIANRITNMQEKAFAYSNNVKPYLESIRECVDNLEMEIDNEIWPLPKYRELLFAK
ncbi:MAG: glutamine synthetase type III, partial [Bacteroidales bacterium]|nr:glutamine synthetase type III [Bacteroidales bacterium]